MDRIIIGLLGILAGILLTVKNEWYVRNFGYITWAETHLHTLGGTRLLLKVIGILVSFWGMLFMTGMTTPFILWILKPLLRNSGGTTTPPIDTTTFE